MQLYAEVRAFSGADLDSELDVPGAPADVVLPLRFSHARHELTFFSTVAVFGTPLDITVDELAIELFFPSDSATAAYLRTRAK